MSGLANVLERFNRKERNLLLRDALGHAGAPLRLSADFRQRIANKLGIAGGVPENAWWATDYHINWLAGGLTLYLEGETSLKRAWPNSPPPGRRLLEGNQEDVDLLIAWDNELVLVEAKAYGTFSNEQMKSKLARLELLHAHYERLLHVNERPVHFHLLLVSPKCPLHLESLWPSWAWKGVGIPWMPLELKTSAPVLTVTRCDRAQKRSAKENHWKILTYQSIDRATTLHAQNLGTQAQVIQSKRSGM